MKQLMQVMNADCDINMRGVRRIAVPCWKLYVWCTSKFHPPMSDDEMSYAGIVVDCVCQNTVLQLSYS